MAMPVPFSTLFWRANLNSDREKMIRDRLLSEGIEMSDEELASVSKGFSYLQDLSDEIKRSLEHIVKSKKSN